LLHILKIARPFHIVDDDIIITGCAAQACIKGDWLCKWERAIFDPHRIDNPKPMTKKIVTGDYVGDLYGCAKLGTYPTTGGGFWYMGEI